MSGILTFLNGLGIGLLSLVFAIVGISILITYIKGRFSTEQQEKERSKHSLVDELKGLGMLLGVLILAGIIVAAVMAEAGKFFGGGAQEASALMIDTIQHAAYMYMG